MTPDIWTKVGIAAAAAMGLLSLAWVMSKGITLRAARRHGVFAAIAVLMSLYAGTKPPKPEVEYPNGLRDDGTCFDTNTWKSVTFKWSLSTGYPADAVLTFSYRTLGSEDPWTQFQGTVVASALEHVQSTASLIPAEATNWEYSVTSEYHAGEVRILDFEAYACTTQRFVTCRWTCPTNVVGNRAIVQYRMKESGSIGGQPDTWHDAVTVFMQTNNAVNVEGNFVSRGLDREFRVFVPATSTLTRVYVRGMPVSLIRGDASILLDDRTEEDARRFRDGIILKESILEVAR